MVLKFKAFDVPTRPRALTSWGIIQVCLQLLALGMFGYLTGTWLSLLLIGYALGIEATFWVRECFWHRYADRCEATFVEIGETADTLAGQIQALAREVEAREAKAAAMEDGDPGYLSEWKTYWVANRKGQH